MIDIQKLKQFPLGFRLFETYIYKQYGSTLFLYNDSGIIKNEDVLLFLDEQKMFLMVYIDPTGKSWEYAVYDVGIYIRSSPEYSSRTIATEIGIEKAFELLENKLKTN